MNRTFPQTMVIPNMPLRRPSTSPGDPPVSPKNLTPSIGTPERPLVTLNGDGGGAEGVVRSMMGSLPPITVKLCNYCSQQGNLLCTRCKRTWYCSLACQKANWNAHRHLCMPSTPETPASEPKETPMSPVGNGSNAFNSKMNHCVVAGPQRVYLHNLGRNNLTKGSEVQVSVVELHSPGRFFIQVQSPETMECLTAISAELQKSSITSVRSTYVPEQREVCAVKFSLDQHWYRGMVKSVSSDQMTASILYIDFGNEESVTVDRIKPLPAAMAHIPPCAVQCCVAGIVPATECWTEECSIAVKQLVAGKSLTLTVVDIQESDRVYSVDVLLSTIGKNLSTLLVAQGYAVKVTNKQCSEQDIVSASLENFRSQSGGKNENTDAQPPDPLTQGLGDSFAAVVTHLQSPDDIICQKLENASVIQKLQMKLREYCCQAPVSVNFRPAPGTVCCALFSEDNQWYRATVLAYSSEERVCVGYIDFGNSEEVDVGCLQPVSPELLALPMQAIPCALAGLRPAEGVWSEDCVQMLRRTVCNRFLRVEILGESEGRALVTMVDEASDPQANVAEVLIATGYALPADPSSSQDTEAVTRKETLEWSCLELPCEGQQVALFVSMIETPGEFYCNVYNTKELQVLAELRVELTQYCEANHTPFTPTVGVPCCAMFSEDGVWYRGMVQEVSGEGEAKVFFVDYGNSSKVEKSHLRAIPPHLLRHPFQAIRCFLAGVEPLGLQWSSEALRHFQALCVGHQLQGRVLSITEQGYGMELESGGQNVGAALVSQQLARASGQPLTPASKETTAGTDPPAATPTDHKEHHKEMPKRATQREAHAVVPVPKEAASFPVDWKTEELPSNQTLKPRIVAVVSPSLFYLFNPNQVEREQLQQVMKDLSVYCSSQACPSQTTPPPGAACCAQLPVDKRWYRAVVLETWDTEALVLCADYGNSEKVTLSSILPIPRELLQLPFQICRCALQGRENFPVVWPAEVLELFRALLSDGVLASKQTFDGSYNLLSVTLSGEHGQGHLNSMILEGLQSTETPAKTTTSTAKIHHTLTATATPNLAQITPTPKPHPTPTATTTQNAAGSTETTPVVLERSGPRHSGESAKPAAPPGKEHTSQVKSEPNDPQSATCSKSSNGSPCCCVQLKTQIDNLERLILSLMKLVELPK